MRGPRSLSSQVICWMTKPQPMWKGSWNGAPFPSGTFLTWGLIFKLAWGGALFSIPHQFLLLFLGCCLSFSFSVFYFCWLLGCTSQAPLHENNCRSCLTCFVLSVSRSTTMRVNVKLSWLSQCQIFTPATLHSPHAVYSLGTFREN